MPEDAIDRFWAWCGQHINAGKVVFSVIVIIGWVMAGVSCYAEQNCKTIFQQNLIVQERMMWIVVLVLGFIGFELSGKK